MAEHYDPVSKAAHWLTAALLTAQYVLGWALPEIGSNTQPTGLIRAHLTLGASILVIVLLRLAWRVGHPGPALSQRMPKWQVRAARLTHWALYLSLLCLSVVGWVCASARQWPVKAFGFVQLPSLTPVQPQSAAVVGDWHAAIANGVLFWLIMLHVGAAAYHRFVKRDEVLQRMLPASKFRVRWFRVGDPR
jgi:cytochrome b561